MGTWGNNLALFEVERIPNGTHFFFVEHMAGETSMLLSLNICGMTFCGGKSALMCGVATSH